MDQLQLKESGFLDSDEVKFKQAVLPCGSQENQSAHTHMHRHVHTRARYSHKTSVKAKLFLVLSLVCNFLLANT